MWHSRVVDALKMHPASLSDTVTHAALDHGDSFEGTPMETKLNKNRSVVAAVALGAGVLAVAGCSSSTTTPTATPVAPTAAATSAPAPASGVPAPPAGSTVVSAPAADGAATYARYSTALAPPAVIAAYSAALTSSGYTITSSGGGGGGWGQYGGSGAGVSANTASSYVAVNAGGSKQGATYFEVCSGPSSASLQSCQQGNHGNSNQS